MKLPLLLDLIEGGSMLLLLILQLLICHGYLSGCLHFEI